MALGEYPVHLWESVAFLACMCEAVATETKVAEAHGTASSVPTDTTTVAPEH